MFDKWYLITIDDPKFLPDESIINVVKLFLKIIKFNYVVLNDINGSAYKDWLIATLQKQENIPIRLDEFLKLICNVNQFEWGDFFLFREYPENWNNCENIANYPKLIIQTDTTIRAVDGQYIYIYTRYKQIVHLIEENYEIESLKTDTLEKLDYPY